MLSRRAYDNESGENMRRPLLRLAMLETCELVWNDAQLIQQVREVTSDDKALHSILAFFRSDHQHASTNIRRRFQDYNFRGGVLYFQDKVVVPNHEEL